MNTYIVDYKTKFGKNFICVDADDEFDAIRIFYLGIAADMESDPWVPDHLKEGKNFYQLALENHTVIQVTRR